MLSLLFALFVVGSAAETGRAGDLAKIDRTIAKEPAYKAKPKYCLMVFGPEARTRAWIVQDGASIYIDRNGNGDLTEPGEMVAWRGDLKTMELGTIHGTDGKSLGTLVLRKFQTSVRLVFSDATKQRYLIGDPDGDPLVFADRPADAPVAHVGGPLSVDLSYYDRLCLRVRVGTAGLGKGTFAAMVLPTVVPVAEIEFPPKEPNGPPLVVKARLEGQ
jgi:hypothetical protein